MRKLRARRQGESNGMLNTIDEINAKAAAPGAVSAGAAWRALPPDGLRGTVHFSQSEIDEFCRRGFLKTERPDWFTMQNALFDVLDAAWAANLTPIKPPTADAVPEK
jgi:hypothetical protein